MKRLEVSTEEIDKLLERPVVTIPEGARCFRVGETNFRRALDRREIDLPVISIGDRKVIPTSAIRHKLGLAVSG